MYLGLRGKYPNEEPVDKKTRDYAKKIFDETDVNDDTHLSTDEVWELAQKIDSKIAYEDLTKIKYYLDVDDDLNLDLGEFLPFVDLILKNKTAREAATAQ
ncbi:hypothetical protein BGZ81_005254 [Podila clonocystis]|nr:hypothetical protein BGZ81_005254 [Podila clonocystis]